MSLCCRLSTYKRTLTQPRCCCSWQGGKEVNRWGGLLLRSTPAEELSLRNYEGYLYEKREKLLEETRTLKTLCSVTNSPSYSQSFMIKLNKKEKRIRISPYTDMSSWGCLTEHDHSAFHVQTSLLSLCCCVLFEVLIHKELQLQWAGQGVCDSDCVVTSQRCSSCYGSFSRLVSKHRLCTFSCGWCVDTYSDIDCFIIVKKAHPPLHNMEI